MCYTPALSIEVSAANGREGFRVQDRRKRWAFSACGTWACGGGLRWTHVGKQKSREAQHLVRPTTTPTVVEVCLSGSDTLIALSTLLLATYAVYMCGFSNGNTPGRHHTVTRSSSLHARNGGVSYHLAMVCGGCSTHMHSGSAPCFSAPVTLDPGTQCGWHHASFKKHHTRQAHA